MQKRRLENIKLLVEKGVDIETRNNERNTPLLEASRYGHIEVVKFLVESVADIDHKNKWGNTPLMGASCYEHIEVVKFLIEKGADIDHKNNNGHNFTYYLTKEEIETIIIDIQHRKEMIKPCKKRYLSEI